MSKYLLKNEIVTEEFWVADDGKEMSIRDDISDLPEDKQKEYTKEWVKYKVPSWQDVSIINETSMVGMSPFPNQQTVDRMLIMLCLYQTSFFDVKRGVPEEEEGSPEQVLNINEMLGPEGVVPKLVNKIVLVLRRRI